VYIKIKEIMGCDCKNKNLRRAKVILHNREWEDLNDIEMGQIEGFYHSEHGGYGTEEEVINWVNSK